MNDINSFFQLLSKYEIEIPVIQRDYAQGRDNPKAEDVRKGIVGKIFSALKNNEPLFFDFIYGRIESRSGKFIFIPFDGQQRLTTLFLVHKYVFEKCSQNSDCIRKDTCGNIDLLKRFSYHTRQSSREFCAKLVENVIISENKKISEFIIDQPWFSPYWKNDPTIMGMLRMLDEIQKQFQEQFKDISEPDCQKLAEQLTNNNCPITFHFVDMGMHRLSDDTYIKMNARGKELTGFENFKASLEEYLDELKKDEIKDRLNKNIDTKWTDLFWKKDEENKVLPDALMMSFINRHLLNVWHLPNKDKETDEEYDRKIEEYDPIIHELLPYPNNDDFISWDIYKIIFEKCDVEKCLTPIFNIWDKLSEHENEILNASQAFWDRDREGNDEKKWNLYEGKKINNDMREIYPSQIAYYALLKYFSKGTYNQESLGNWMRVVWNIITHSTINSIVSYCSALSLIEEISVGCDNIYDWLAEHEPTSDFAKDQVQEELKKAKLMQDDTNWNEILKKSERFPLLQGAVRILFEKPDNIKCTETMDNFENCWEHLNKVFDKNGTIKENYQNEASLLRAVVSHIKVNEIWNNLLYDNNVFNHSKSTWQDILTELKWHNPLHNMILNNDFEIDKTTTFKGKEWKEKLFKTHLLQYIAEKKKNSRIRWIHNHWAIYPPNSKHGGCFLNADLRDEILSAWLSDGKIELCDGKNCFPIEETKNDETKLFWGWDIYFKLKNSNQEFIWDESDNIYWSEKKRETFIIHIEKNMDNNILDKLKEEAKKLAKVKDIDSL